jgi:mono/diheme cytochrome c family protein
LRTRALNPILAAALLSLLSLTAVGCRQNMHNQNKAEPFEASDFFADGQASRQLPPNTVARHSTGAKVAPYTGLTIAPARVGPPQVSMQLMRRGQERFNVFCSPCHSRVGDGRGMIVQRGFKQPTSFHDPRLVSAPTDYFVQVITEGFGVMPSYAPQVPMDDRWAIAYYVRALQYSQNARLADLPAAQRQNVERLLANPQGTGGLDPGVPSVPEEHLDDARSDTPMEMENR